MKDENNGKIMTEFVGLRAKLYAFKKQDDKEQEKKRAKGVKHSILKTITCNDFVNCLIKHEEISEQQSLIRSKKHNVCTITQSKLHC